MNQTPRLIAVSLVLGASLWTWAIASATGQPFGNDSAVLVGIGLLMFSLIAAIGILLPRARWARNLARVVLGAEVLLATVTQLGGWAIAALIATAIGIIGVQGKWLDGWLRRLPAADGPDVKAILFVLGCLALVPALGVASPAGLEIRQGLLGAAGVAIAWGYSKAQLWALWAGRLAIAPLVGVAAALAPPAGAALLIALGSILVWLAWSEPVRLAISPLLDTLPGPRPMPQRPEVAD